MKIVFLIRSLTFGGAERQLVALARGLHARGHDVHVAVFYAGGPLAADLHSAGVPVTVLDKSGRWDTVGFLCRLARFLRRERPDVVHGYLGTSNYLSLLTKPLHGGRAVWGIRASDIDAKPYDWFYRLDARIEHALASFPDLIIANSNAGRDHALANGFPAAKTIVIPNGIDADRFRPDNRLRAVARADLGVADNQLLVGRIGRIDYQKDYPTFLRAAAAIAQKRPNTRFICVGAGPTEYERDLRALGDDLGLGDRLIWAGSRSDMPAVYNALDVLVSSSAYGEGLPNVVAEAMACGVPCAVTDSGDSAWVVGDQGKVVLRGDAHALAAATIELLDAVTTDAIDRVAIRQRVVANLALDRLVERTEAALLPLLREWSPA
jgi:glycosyltransferase involved in cell wall biosynthesis